MVCEDSKFVLINPRDPRCSAREDFRTNLKRKYDLVLVPNGYPLEPNYVLIQNIPKSVNLDDIRNLNLSKIQGVNLSTVKIFIQNQKNREDSPQCTLIFDFVADSILTASFADILQRHGLILDNIGGPNSIMMLS